MVDWKSSGIQLISTLAGSSLFLFGITTFFTEYIQKPQVEIFTHAERELDFAKLNNVSAILLQEENETTIHELKYHTSSTIRNHGNTPATNVRVTFLLDDISSDIIVDKPRAYSEENFTKILEEPKLMTWEIPRLATGSTFTMNVNVTQNHTGPLVPTSLFEAFPEFFPASLRSAGNKFEAWRAVESYYSPSYTISAAADHGTTVEDVNSGLVDFIGADLAEQLLSNISAPISANVPLIALSAVSILIIFMPRISNVIRRRRVGNEQAKMVSAILSEIKIVHDALKENIGSKQIFACKVWHSAPFELKRQIFDNYDDYDSINNFFEEMEIRDSLLAAKSDAFRIENKELLQMSSELIRKVKWAKYRMIHFSVPIAITTLSALAVFFGEWLIVVLPLFVVFNTSQDNLPFALFIMTIIGGVIAFAFLSRILNIQTIFSKKESDQFRLVLSRGMKIRLLVLCFIVGGALPLLGVLSTYFPEYDLTSQLGISVIVVGGVLTILIMALLVSYASRRIKECI